MNPTVAENGNADRLPFSRIRLDLDVHSQAQTTAPDNRHGGRRNVFPEKTGGDLANSVVGTV